MLVHVKLAKTHIFKNYVEHSARHSIGSCDAKQGMATCSSLSVRGGGTPLDIHTVRQGEAVGETTG